MVTAFAFIVGLFVGTTVGILAAGLMCAAGKDKTKDQDE
jgi:hypothetical protein